MRIFPEIIETRQVILSAMKYLTVQSGSSKVTVQMLADYCGISRKTFYYHFSDIFELSKWIFRSELGLLLTENFSESDLVFLPEDSRQGYPEFPYYARSIVGVRQLDGSLFFKLFYSYFEENRSYYKALFSSFSDNFSRYACQLYGKALNNDIYFILGGRRLPSDAIKQLSCYFVNGTILGLVDATTNTKRDLRTIIPEEFPNLVHDALSSTINASIRQRKNAFSFFES